MAISKDTVKYISQLSKLEIPNDSDGIIKELNAFVGYMDILNQLNTDNVEPISHILSLKNVMRDDKVEPSVDRKLILLNSPADNDEYFVVPKTVE